MQCFQRFGPERHEYNPQNVCKKLQNQKKQKANEKESNTGTQEGFKQVFKEIAGYMITFQKKS